MAKKPEKKEAKAVASIDSFEIMNQGKYERAIEAAGGDENKALVLAHYDRLGGFIRYQGNKVLNGAFWDRKTDSPVENPEPKIRRQQQAVVEETIEMVKPAKDEQEAPKKKTTKKKTTKKK